MFTHLLFTSDSNNPKAHSLHYRPDKMLLVDVESKLVTLVCKSSGPIYPKLLIAKSIVVLLAGYL